MDAPSYPDRWVAVRDEHGRVVSQGVLLVSGLRGDDGRREILGVTLADTERAAFAATTPTEAQTRAAGGAQ